MFYTGGDPPGGPSIEIGPIKLSIAQIKIGFTSSLVVIPVNLLIVTLFKKAGPKMPKKDKNAEKYEVDAEEEDTKSETSSRPKSTCSTISRPKSNVSRVTRISRLSRVTYGSDTNQDRRPSFIEEGNVLMFY